MAKTVNLQVSEEGLMEIFMALDCRALDLEKSRVQEIRGKLPVVKELRKKLYNQAAEQIQL